MTDTSGFTFGHTVYRMRPTTMVDPYSQQTVTANWRNPDMLALPGAFVAHTSTSLLADAERSEAAEAKSLFIGVADIRKGDRIRNGDEGAAIYTIDGIPPEPDTNPFTGWTPPREIPLTRYVG